VQVGYRALAGILREAIKRGEHQPGETLPKQEDLADTYGVNIKTVRRAVGLLEAEGLVTPVRRRGTVVRPRPPMKRLGIERYAKSKWKTGLVAFAADREASGRDWRFEDQTNTVRKVPAEQEVADALALPMNTLVYERSRLVSEAGAPTHILTSYYRAEDVEGTPLVDASADHGGGFAVLTLQGLEPHTITETFSTRMPTPAEAEWLQLPAGEPVMLLQRVTTTDGGRVVEFARGLHAGSRFSWSYSFAIPD